MKRLFRRHRPGLTRRALNAYLNRAMPCAVQCYPYRFGNDSGKWSACTATREMGSILGWVSATTYADAHTALCAAYRRVRPPLCPQVTLVGQPEFVIWSKS